MHIGFTGTQLGMTDAQKEAVLQALPPDAILHHGDCIGADAQAHEIAREKGLQVFLHPPKEEQKRAFCCADFVYPKEEYLDRNQTIVNVTEVLIATPKEMEETLRSGTWATIRFARKRRRPVTIVYPDGSLG